MVGKEVVYETFWRQEIGQDLGAWLLVETLPEITSHGPEVEHGEEVRCAGRKTCGDLPGPSGS